MEYRWRAGSSEQIEAVERNKRETGREDNREGRTVRGREREELRERLAKVERRIAEYGRSQKEECEKRIEEYTREQRESPREEEGRRPGRLIIRYTRKQREVIRADEEQEQDRNLKDRLRRKK